MAQKIAFSKNNCLIAATDELYCRLIESALEQIGLSEVLTAGGIEDALQRTSTVYFDVIVCADPEMERALTMMQRIRETAPKSPVIIVTSRVSPEFLAIVAEQGAAFVIAMPINSRKLLKTLARAINEPRGPGARPAESRPEPRGGGVSSAATAPGRFDPPRETAVARPLPEPDQTLSARDAKLLTAANQISDSIDRLKQSLNATDDAQTRRLLRQQLADAAQRLVNLLALEKPEAGGSLGNHLAQKLQFVREAFFDVIAEICRSRVEMVRGDLEKYLDRKEFVVGYVDSVFDRLASIEEIITVMGGPQKLGNDTKRSLGKAWSDAGDLQQNEKTVIALTDLSHEDSPKKTRAAPKQRYSYEIDDSADSQSDVLTAIKSKK